MRKMPILLVLVVLTTANTGCCARFRNWLHRGSPCGTTTVAPAMMGAPVALGTPVPAPQAAPAMVPYMAPAPMQQVVVPQPQYCCPQPVPMLSATGSVLPAAGPLLPATCPMLPALRVRPVPVRLRPGSSRRLLGRRCRGPLWCVRRSDHLRRRLPGSGNGISVRLGHKKR